MNILLQILEDGQLTDSQGRKVDFKNTVIIMTSNIGARHITEKKTLGFGESQNNNEQKEYEEIKKEVIQELKKELRPEFINRIDEIIVFHKLNTEDLKQITKIMLKQMEKRLKENKYYIEIDESVIDLIVKKGADKTLGARPLRRAIQNNIENRISEEILDGTITQNKKAKIIAKGEEIIIDGY